jgi:hypothetical protein
MGHEIHVQDEECVSLQPRAALPRAVLLCGLYHVSMRARALSLSPSLSLSGLVSNSRMVSAPCTMHHPWSCSLSCSLARSLRRYLDMATAISGSGPAYYYMVMEAMIDSAVHMGFSRDVARTLVLQTMKVRTTFAPARLLACVSLLLPLSAVLRCQAVAACAGAGAEIAAAVAAWRGDATGFCRVRHDNRRAPGAASERHHLARRHHGRCPVRDGERQFPHSCRR